MYVREWIILLSGLHRLLWQVDGRNENVRCDAYMRRICYCCCDAPPAVDNSECRDAYYTYANTHILLITVSWIAHNAANSYCRFLTLKLRAAFITLLLKVGLRCSAAKLPSTGHTQTEEKTHLSPAVARSIAPPLHRLRS